MAQTQWSEEAPPPKKKSIPTWVWFCSGGCLLAVLGLVIAGWLGMNFVGKMQDPDVQWPKVAQILPFDERPTNLQLMFGSQIGIQQYQFMDHERDLVVVLQRMPGDAGQQARKAMFDSETPALQGNVLGMLDLQDVQTGTVSIQGRDVKVVRANVQFGKVLKGVTPEEAEGMGPTAYIDLTQPDEGAEYTMLQVSRVGAREPLSDDDLRELLRPFHVGPVR